MGPPLFAVIDTNRDGELSEDEVKAAADVYMPISGEIFEVNDTLRDDPSLANTDPLGAGWFFKVKLTDVSQLAALMDETAYGTFSANA